MHKQLYYIYLLYFSKIYYVKKPDGLIQRAASFNRDLSTKTHLTHVFATLGLKSSIIIRRNLGQKCSGQGNDFFCVLFMIPHIQKLFNFPQFVFCYFHYISCTCAFEKRRAFEVRTFFCIKPRISAACNTVIPNRCAYF